MIEIKLSFESIEEINALFGAPKRLKKCEHVLRELDNDLRESIKYKELSEDKEDALQETRDYLWRLLNEEGIDLYDEEG